MLLKFNDMVVDSEIDLVTKLPYQVIYIDIRSNNSPVFIENPNNHPGLLILQGPTATIMRISQYFENCATPITLSLDTHPLELHECKVKRVFAGRDNQTYIPTEDELRMVIIGNPIINEAVATNQSISSQEFFSSMDKLVKKSYNRPANHVANIRELRYHLRLASMLKIPKDKIVDWMKTDEASELYKLNKKAICYKRYEHAPNGDIIEKGNKMVCEVNRKNCSNFDKAFLDLIKEFKNVPRGQPDRLKHPKESKGIKL